eukprot:gene5600-1001_t
MAHGAWRSIVPPIERRPASPKGRHASPPLASLAAPSDDPRWALRPVPHYHDLSPRHDACALPSIFVPARDTEEAVPLTSNPRGVLNTNSFNITKLRHLRPGTMTPELVLLATTMAVTASADTPQPGSTVDPTTKGIWVWGQPLAVSDGPQTVLLDTEGFSSSGVSQQYDAEFFGVTALMIITANDIEQLELLARRARLFQIKSTIGNSSELWPSGLWKFPPLTWVVQDFVSRTSGETHTEWLDRLLAEKKKDNSSDTGLRDVFTQLQDLASLDSADPSRYTPQYKRDLEALVTLLGKSLRQENQACTDRPQDSLPHIPDAVSPECDRGDNDGIISTHCTNASTPSNPSLPMPENTPCKMLSGQEFVARVRMLVHAANQGNMLAIPSMWRMVLQNQVAEARGAAFKLFETRAALLLVASPPQPESEFAKELDLAQDDAESTYSEILFNFHGAWSQ